MSRSVSAVPVRDDGLFGVLCRPDGIGSTPGVLLLGGSEGGLHQRDAEVLASEGFTVLALAYFGAPGLPPGLIDIPLEYFARGLDVLAKHCPGPLGVTGGSRGGEAALLVAAHDERIGAVVSVVGSGVVTEGIDFRRGNLLAILEAGTNSWTFDGDQIPYLPYEISDDLRDRATRRRTVELSSAFAPVPDDLAVLDRVSIPIERSDSAVLLLSADDDRSWPSQAYSEVAAERLRRHGKEVTHHVFEGAGHLIAGPPGRTIMATTSPGPGVTFEMGGTPAATTAARDRAWAMTVDFFAEHLD